MARTSGEQLFTVGREGLRVPVPQAAHPEVPQLDVVRFFEQLRVLNSLGDVGEQSTYDGELILPPEADKPLVIIHGAYEPTSRGQQERQSTYHRDPITFGYIKHAVWIPPKTKRTSWDVQLATSEADRRGTYIGNRILPPPAVYFSGSWYNQHQVPAQEAEQYAAETETLRGAVRVALQRTVELLSVPD